jgi:protease IV
MRMTNPWRLAAILGLATLLAPAAMAEKKVLRLVFDGPILEQASPDAMFFSMLMGGSKPRTLRGVCDEINKAAADANVAGIALIIDQAAANLPQVEELTRTLAAFRGKGKKVLAYLDYATNGSYALAVAADHITFAENSDLSLTGLHAELSYYKGMLDKLGVEAEMLHCGAYKSALEPYVRTSPSPEAAENVNWLLDGIFNRWVQLLADGRKLSVEQIKDAVDQGGLTSSEALKRKLVDSVGSLSDFKQLIDKEFGADATVIKSYSAKEKLEFDTENPFAIFSMFSEMMEKSSATTKPGIALIHVDGGIIVGKSQADMLSGSSTAGSTTIRAALEQAADDPNIKAVVLRVDSPGGSAIASDIIWKSASRCAKAKPLIVSMGRVAGSGGYYVAIPGDTIFAEETTITGSIGVVGGKMVLKGLFEDKLGITTTEFSRGKRAGIMSSNRKWNDDERGWITGYMNSVYEQFKGRVTASRGPKIKGNLEDLAGGRVYTGRQALERGLVDKIGGLQDAFALAASKAGLKDYETYALPRDPDLADVLRKMMGEDTQDEYEVQLTLGNDPLNSLVGAAAPLLKTLAPHQLRSAVEALRQLSVLNAEHVSCFQPLDVQLR